MGSGFVFYTFTALLLFSSFVMILLVLIQRGRGGGLAGAFGGMGGQSAFGTRAGDIFTKITVGVAVVWVLAAGLLGISMRSRAEAIRTGQTSAYVEGADAADDEAAAEDDGEAPVMRAEEDDDGPLTSPLVPETSADGIPSTDPDAGEAESADEPQTSVEPDTAVPAEPADDTDSSAAPAADPTDGSAAGTGPDNTNE